ncbi:hypothetical protein V1512DRAFT_268537 [Lipomyces arxii]|uniref:uncharacterized protein n=1 Tax=Lipomyces arxii TaxID=56418 RepID=UPI0034CFA109
MAEFDYHPHSGLYPGTFYSAPSSACSDNPQQTEEIDELDHLVNQRMNEQMGTRGYSEDTFSQCDQSSSASSISQSHQPNSDLFHHYYNPYFAPAAQYIVAPYNLTSLNNIVDSDVLRAKSLPTMDVSSTAITLSPMASTEIIKHRQLQFRFDQFARSSVNTGLPELSPISPTVMPPPLHSVQLAGPAPISSLPETVAAQQTEPSRVVSAEERSVTRRQGHNRNYRCRHCALVFSDADSLKRHILTLPDASLSQRPYKCSDQNCDWHIIGFHRNNDCSRHFRQVHGVREFVCRWQGARECRTHRFVTAWLRNRHEQTVHARHMVILDGKGTGKRLQNQDAAAEVSF